MDRLRMNIIPSPRRKPKVVRHKIVPPIIL
jgi:hypothetical protein